MPKPFEIKNLYDQGNFNAIADFYNSVEELNQMNEWDLLYCMNSAYKLKDYASCLEIYKNCKTRFPACTRLNDKMCWSLYHIHIKGFDFDNDDVKVFFRQVDYIFKNSEESKYSARWLVLKNLLDAINKNKLKMNVEPGLINKYLDGVNPNNLSTEEGSFTDKSGKTIHLASDMEKWYSEKSKALIEMEAYEACIKLCNEALRRLSSFHSNNDSWFKYRMAMSLTKLNKLADAKKLIEEIINSGMKHWCFWQQLFVISSLEGNEENSLKYGAYCALTDREHKMRVGFYEDFAAYLLTIDKSYEAQLHRRLVLLLRDENGWKLKNYHLEWQLDEAVKAMDMTAVLKELRKSWTEQRDSGKVFLEGVVDKVLPSGRDGFVKTDNGARYYFNVRDIVSGTKNISEGLVLKFRLEDRLDRKRGITKPNAVDIRVISK